MNGNYQGKFRFSLFVYLLFLLPSFSLAQIPVGGSISEDSTWVVSSNILLNSNLVVETGATLTIESGTSLNLTNKKITVYGKLLINGTSGSPVSITTFSGGEIHIETNEICDFNYLDFRDFNHKVTIVNSTVNFNNLVLWSYAFRNFALTNSVLNLNGVRTILDDNYGSLNTSIINAKNNTDSVSGFTIPANSTVNLIAETGKDVEVRIAATDSLKVYGTLNTSTTDPANVVRFNLETIYDHAIDIVNASDCSLSGFEIKSSSTAPPYAFRVINTKVDFEEGGVVNNYNGGFLRAIASTISLKNLNMLGYYDSPDSTIVKMDNGSLTVTGCEFTSLPVSRAFGFKLTDVSANFSTTNFTDYGHISSNESMLNYQGGAINATNGTLNFVACTFNNCIAYNGGALYATGTNFTIEDCDFKNNTATYNGGAINVKYVTGNVLLNRFESNQANFGGGVYTYDSELLVVNSVFDSNVAYKAGGMYVENDDYVDRKTSVLNNVFYGNRSSLISGSGLVSSSAVLQISNSIFWGNSPIIGGSGTQSQIEVAVGNELPQINNNIIENNELNFNLNIDYSGFVFANNSSDPEFVDPATSDFQVSPTSPAINAGSEDVSGIIWTKDIGGNDRIYSNTRIDIGIYESKATINPSDSLALVDIYNATGGTGWANKTGWLTENVTNWYGVRMTGGRVCAINLATNNLTGAFPSTVTSLNAMDSLLLSDNKLTSIPQEITQMSRLKVIDFSNNLLTAMPDLTNNTFYQLNKLDVKGNLMTFEDLLPNSSFANFLYAPQMEVIHTPSSVNVSTGGSETLSMDNLMSAPNDITYTWYQDGTNVQTSSDKAFNITNAQALDGGTYTCKAMHSGLPLLVLERTPVEVNIIPPPANDTDSAALVAIYNACNGPNWTNKTGWLSDELKNWYGVSMVDGRVVGLYLSFNNLSGTLPNDVNLLSALEILDLAYNNLTGTFNIDFTKFNLKELDLSNNDLGGNLPSSIPAAYPLIKLNLSSNKLSGTVPETLGNATSLVSLNLSSNEFTGNLPSGIANLIALSDIDMSDNKLDGAIDVNFSNLTALLIVNLSKNRLTGGFPTGLSHSSITQIDLSNNALSGSLPTDWSSLIALSTLSVANNQFSGAIPDGFSALKELETLTLSNNALTGGLPAGLGTLPKLKYLNLDHNKLSGELPIALADLTTLIELHLSFNDLSGNVPDIFSNYAFMRKLSLDNNAFEGPIPAEIGSITNLTTLSLYANQFSGVIPPQLGNLSFLEVLELNKNKLSGLIPDELGTLTSLKTLSLRSNQLSGEAPVTLNDLLQLERFYIYDNKLTGFPELNGLKNLEALQVFQNKLQFDDIIPNLDVCDDFQYRPQLDSISEIIASVGQSLTLGASVSGEGNVYKWTKDLIDLSNSTNSYTLPMVLQKDSGQYLLQVTNPSVPDLILQFYYNVQVPEGDLPANSLDSLALVKVYEQCGGQNWENSTNWLTGQLKNWHGVTVSQGRVVALDLSRNKLAGALPMELNNLEKLSVLNLSHNQIASEWIFDLSKLPLLTEINISNNLFYEVIPDEFPVGAVLNTLHIASNKFSGTFPETVANLTKLILLDINSNSFSSSLPAGIAACTMLKELYASDNGFSGEITIDFSKLNQLTSLKLSKNSFSGSFPVGLITKELPLTVLDLSDNDFSGSIPTEISKLHYLKELKLSLNNFTGQIPSEIGALKELEYLGLNNNALDGGIPNEIGDLIQLLYLRLDRNKLTGSIPEALSKLALLLELNLNFNELSGSIPEIFGEMEELLVLSLSNNNLTGSIPKQIGDLHKATTLSLYANQLTGSLPSELGELTFLEVLEVNKNQLSGELPEELGNLRSLKTLSIRSNKFSGRVPDSFSQLVQLEKWYMYDNEFTGIPDLSPLVNLEALQIFSNRIEFEDIITNLNVCDDFQYAPQRDYTETFSVTTSDVITVGKEVTGSGNVYVWYENAVKQSINSAIQTFTANEGVYELQVTNVKAPELTLIYTYEVITDPTTPNIVMPKPYCTGDLNVHLENIDGADSYWYWDEDLTQPVVSEPTAAINVNVENDQDTIYVVNRVFSKVSEVVSISIKKRPTISISGTTFDTNLESGAEYKWFLNDKLISTERTINASENGTYMVTITLDGCSSSSNPLYWEDGTVVGIQDEFRFDDMKLYPNPTDGRMNIEWDNLIIGELEVEIISFDGRIVQKEYFQKQSQNFKQEILVDNLQTGDYFCKLKVGNAIIVKQFIKF